MSVLFLTEDDAGASTRYRILQYLPAFESSGIAWDCVAIPEGRRARRALFRRASSYDQVVVQRRLVHPFDVRLLRRNARRLVFDFDDAILYPDSFQRKRRSTSRWLKFLAIATNADLVIAGSEYLASVTMEFQRNVAVIPTVVDSRRYPVRDAAAVAGELGDRPLRLVWIGSRSTLPYLEDVLAPIASVASRREMVLRVIADAAPRSTGSLSIETVPWSSDVEVDAIASCDIGLAPLRDDRWSHGKCGLRLLQYFAAGVPAVATPIGAQSAMIAGEHGEMAATPDEFGASVERLAADPERRMRMARRARSRLEREYDPAVWSARFIGAVTGDPSIDGKTPDGEHEEA